MQASFAIALVCLGVIGLASWLAIDRSREDAAWVEHTHQVIVRLEQLFSTMTDAQNGHRGFVLTGDEQFIEPYNHAQRTAPTEMEQLRALTRDNARQQERLQSLAALISALLDRSRHLIELRRAGGMEAGLREALTGSGRQLHEDFRRVIDEIKQTEQTLLMERKRQADHSSAITRAIIGGGGLFGFAFMGFAVVAMRRDFAGRRRAETELERFFSLSLDFLCIASADGYFKRVSPAVTDVLGWSMKEFLSKPYLDFIHPDDHAATLAEVDKQILSGQKVLRFENRYRHKDGSWRVLSWRCRKPTMTCAKRSKQCCSRNGCAPWDRWRAASRTTSTMQFRR